LLGGDDTPNSDVDILIDLDGVKMHSTEIKTLMENRVGRNVDLLSMRAFKDPLNQKLSPTFTSQVLKDARVVHA
jgi:predicted nucleotidyltransferase